MMTICGTLIQHDYVCGTVFCQGNGEVCFFHQR